MVGKSKGIVLLSVFLAGHALADIKTARQYIPAAALVGEARMEYLFWDVYDAELYAPDGVWLEDQPFALTLQYLLELDGEAIESRSVTEMRRQGFDNEITLTRWYGLMRTIFPDVDEDTRITGIMDHNRHTLFFKNGDLFGEINEPLFSEWFFNIWLGDKTSEPKLRNRLLGAYNR